MAPTIERSVHVCWLAISLAACAPSVPAPASHSPPQPAASATAAPGAASPRSAQPAVESPHSFGQALPGNRSADVDIAAVLAEPERFGGDALTLHGVVTAVCQRRGCWLELAAADGNTARGCRVVSENHDWFVPHDATGDRARVRGRVEVRTISPEQVAHMESEGGQFAQKQADGSAREVRIIATGVELAGK